MPEQKSALAQISRRRFLKYSSLAGAATFAAPYIMRAQEQTPNNKLNIGVIGAGGKGASDTDACAGENIVALCDVDQNTLDKRAEKYPGAKLFKDYRKMLEEMKNLDAVIVATPDHIHAPASVMAMKMGKHVFCQKPLTHSVYEARTMRETAKKYKVATQMGNQGSAESGLRRAVEAIQGGVIGDVRQLYVWSNRPIWPQGIDRPPGADPVPETLDWDLFLGPAPERPYVAKAYHPFAWRGWQDFGTGALGDMACHTVNMPFRALKMGYPTSIEAKSSGMNKETYPKSSEIRFEFPARQGTPPLSFTWYDGGWKPNDDVLRHVNAFYAEQKDKDGKPRKVPGSGCLLVGSKGQLFSPDDYGSQFLLQFDSEGFKPAKSKIEEKDVEHEAVRGIAQTLPRSPGHYKEWLDACKGTAPPAYSNFDVAAYLTEIILLGCVALQTGKKLDWDGPNLRAKNAPEAARYVKREYRKGWTLG